MTTTTEGLKPTPRTDALLRGRIFYSNVGDLEKEFIDHCRQLERELIVAQASEAIPRPSDLHSGVVPLTDKELCDPEYMLNYVSGLWEMIDEMKASVRNAALEARDAMQRSNDIIPSVKFTKAIAAIDSALSTMPVEPVTNPHFAIQPEAVDAPLAITGWLPIESAPKDGSQFIAWNNKEKIIEFFHWQGPDGDRPVGWRDSFIYVYPEADRKITHWMPLPASPTQSMKDE